MAKNKKEKRSILHRYLGLIISTTMFLVFVAAILAINFYYSSSVIKIRQISMASGELATYTRENFINILELERAYNTNSNSPQIADLLDKVKKSKSLMQTLNKVLLEGGNYVNGAINITIFPERIPEMRDKFQRTQKMLEPLNKKTEIMLNELNIQNINDASKLMLQLRSEVLQLMMENDVTIRKISRKQNDNSNRVTTVGISIVIIYFIIFVVIFMRQLIAADERALISAKETAEILETVNTGLFLMDNKLILGTQYSQELINIIGTDDISNRNLEELLSKMISPHDLDVTKKFIEQLFNERIKERLISDLNPLKRIKVIVRDEKNNMVVRYLNFRFSRVYEGKSIARVLVSVSDITRQVLLEEKLEHEQKQSDQQIETLATILRIDEKMLDSFLRNGLAATNAINEILQTPERSERGLRTKAAKIFREVHSLKGEASALELESFTNITEEFEDKLKELNNKSKISGDDFLPLAVLLEQIIGMFENIQQLGKRLIGFASTQDAATAPRKISEIRAASTSESFIEYIRKFSKQLSARNSKNVNVELIGFKDETLTENQFDLVKDLAIQLLRNAVIHGIESPSERSTSGKDKDGSIIIKLIEMPDHRLELSVRDDGRGIDFEAIRSKAASMQENDPEDVAKWDKKQLMAAMLKSGFSTAKTPNQDAGRGVGTDVIKARVEQLHGRLAIESKKGEHTLFVVRFPR